MKVSRHAKIIELISQYDIETQEELAELRTCLAGAFPARFCMYMGKPAVLDEISKSRDQLEEMEKYVVPDETGILYETRWSFVELSLIHI